MFDTIFIRWGEEEGEGETQRPFAIFPNESTNLVNVGGGRGGGGGRGSFIKNKYLHACTYVLTVCV
jgi:hypothetical protein